MVNSVDKYIADGCGRCKYYATDKCKVRNWQKEIVAIRQIILGCGLVEGIKWGVPVYTINEKNVVILSALKKSVALGFFKGVLMKDPDKIFHQQGKRMQSDRFVRFTSLQIIQALQNSNTLTAYIQEAIDIEKRGEKVILKKESEPIPEELLQKFNEASEFREAFFALTHSRQRGYIIYFSQPKQSQTRVNRIEKYRQKIMDGIGLNDN